MVLVHGFGHGAWCWYKLVSLLRTNGPHRVTALDLAGCGVHPKQPQQISSCSDYVQPLMDFLSALPDDEKAVLVGHSYGGIPIALAMEKFPAKISCAVFVTSYMPNSTHPPGMLIQEFLRRGLTKSFLDCQFTFDQESGKVPISALIGPEYMAAKLYQRCPLEDVELGKMLVRPNLFFVEELSKKSLLSQERYGKIKRCYVICEEDEVMEEEFQRYNIEKSPPDDVITIAGAAHMVMLSKPQELCSCLLELAQKY
ncbi:methylesterase 10 [Phtheirospermum japonicum]|uniref:Methylesterase 10 n=1 Tax=Phtheirospermum japonicum TaxID=374723 RepID=A0A830B0H3_9LAMI|nr:methylesterase 10 [Phtheirospermum japonicum]